MKFSDFVLEDGYRFVALMMNANDDRNACLYRGKGQRGKLSSDTRFSTAFILF